MPWAKLKSYLGPIIERQPEGNRPVIEKRHETINAYNPEFFAVGQGGFDGYVIFGFPSKSLYILESSQTNNATYVLDKDWEVLASLTKAELLSKELHKERLIHRKNWFTLVKGLLKS
ncbi:MAG: hypothetical protein HGA95_04390 [Caldiserica bacterium]|nr:hypothetical protein [Caldisericota bacterium]